MDETSSVDGVKASAKKIIAQYEGLRLKAYPDPATHGAPWTIGYGSTSHADGSRIVPNETWTQEQCAADLDRRLDGLLMDVGSLVQVPLPDEAMAALLSLAYNCGTNVERRSLKNGGLLAVLNAGNYQQAADDFMHYDHAAGAVYLPLERRRSQERDLFLASCHAAGLLS